MRRKKPDVILRPGDIVVTRSNSIISKLIRRFTTKSGEPLSSFSHCELVSTYGLPGTAFAISADRKGVQERRIADYAGRTCRVYRVRFSDNQVMDANIGYNIVDRARTKLGSKYPVWRLFMHLLDWMLFDAFLFRRIGRSSRVMECSSLVAWACDPYLSFKLGERVLPWYLVNPDDLADILDSWCATGGARRVADFELTK